MKILLGLCFILAGCAGTPMVEVSIMTTAQFQEALRSEGLWYDGTNLSAKTTIVPGMHVGIFEDAMMGGLGHDFNYRTVDVGVTGTIHLPDHETIQVVGKTLDEVNSMSRRFTFYFTSAYSCLVPVYDERDIAAQQDDLKRQRQLVLRFNGMLSGLLEIDPATGKTIWGFPLESSTFHKETLLLWRSGTRIIAVIADINALAEQKCDIPS